MPTKKALKERRVDFDELCRLSYEPKVLAALQQWNMIKANGGAPVAVYSEFGGYRVFDKDTEGLPVGHNFGKSHA